MHENILDLISFDPDQRMREIHEINDTLVKIRAGRFDVVAQHYMSEEG